MINSKLNIFHTIFLDDPHNHTHTHTHTHTRQCSSHGVPANHQTGGLAGFYSGLGEGGRGEELSAGGRTVTHLVEVVDDMVDKGNLHAV